MRHALGYGGPVDVPKSWGQGLGWTDVGRLLQNQNRMLEQLPGTLLRLTEVIDGLVPAVAGATEAMAAAARVTARLEALVEELEEPIRRLVPAIERVAVALDNPAVDAVPDTLERIQSIVRPLSDAVARGSVGAASVRGRARRLTVWIRHRWAT